MNFEKLKIVKELTVLAKLTVQNYRKEQMIEEDLAWFIGKVGQLASLLRRSSEESVSFFLNVPRK